MCHRSVCVANTVILAVRSSVRYEWTNSHLGNTWMHFLEWVMEGCVFVACILGSTHNSRKFICLVKIQNLSAAISSGWFTAI